MRKVILGSGIAALTILEMKPDYYLISGRRTLGGQMKNAFPLGPRILHQTAAVDMFLESIGIQARPRQYKVGYVRDDKRVDVLPFADLVTYYAKTRGHKKVSLSSMNGGKKDFWGYDIEEIGLVDILVARNFDRIINSEITSVDAYEKRVNGEPCQHIISTLDYLDLCILSEIDSAFLANTCKREVVFTLVAGDLCPNQIFDFGDVDFIYFVNHPIFNRATKGISGEFVLETNRPISKLELMENGLIKLDEVCTHSQIVKELKKNNLRSIELAGRYAQYDHGVKLNDIIERYSEV